MAVGDPFRAQWPQEGIIETPELPACVLVKFSEFIPPGIAVFIAGDEVAILDLRTQEEKDEQQHGAG